MLPCLLPQFRSHAEKLSSHAHECGAHSVDDPPAEGIARVAVVEPASQRVEEVHGAGEVQAQLRPLNHVPQGQRAEGSLSHLIKGGQKRLPSQGVEDEGGDEQFAVRLADKQQLQ